MSVSKKTGFIIQLLRLNSKIRYLYAFRNEKDQFREKQNGNYIELATSIPGIFVYFALMLIFKTPTDLHDGIINRIYKEERKCYPKKESFLNTIWQAFYQYLARSARTVGVLRFLKKNNSRKIFIIDEFFSLNSFSLKKLKDLGLIIYVTSDIASDFYGDNITASKLMYKFERKKIAFPDIVIACSERDKLKYLEMGAKKVFYYPNIYPIKEFETGYKEQIPCITIVLRGYWGFRANRALEEIFKSLSYIDRQLKVYLIGIKPKIIPKNIDLCYFEYIPKRLDFMKILSKSWIGINIGIHTGGSNQRKYDYAMAGLVVFSDIFGVRGDFLPHEYSFIDFLDLAAKLEQLLSLGKENITLMGVKNRKHALYMAKKKREELLSIIMNLTSNR